jgi:hypothetical protein
VRLTRSLPVLIAALVVTGVGRGFVTGNPMPVMCQFTSPRLWPLARESGALKTTLGLGGAIAIAGVIVFSAGFVFFGFAS